MGKGGARRQRDVDEETFARNWKRIFDKPVKESWYLRAIPLQSRKTKKDE